MLSLQIKRHRCLNEGKNDTQTFRVYGEGERNYGECHGNLRLRKEETIA